MRRIKFVDLERIHKPIKSELNEAISGVIEKNNYILGDDLEIFEERWAKYTGQKYAIGVSSGYHALELSKIACFDGYVHDVIIPTNSFIATASAFQYEDITFSDVNSDNLLIDKDNIENIKNVEVNDEYSCIVPVHLFGQPCNMDKLVRSFGRTKIIEDACQAHGVSSKLIGKGLTTCYSFYPSKNLGCFGDGGIVTTNESEIAEKIRLLRSYGEIRKNFHQIIGKNCRLDTMQSVILNVKLYHLDEWNNERREIAKYYHEELEGIDNSGIKLMPYNRDSVYHLFVIECEDRDRLKEYLIQNGIETGIHYPIPIHKQKAYEEHSNFSLPIAEEKSKKILSLPMYPGLSVDEIAYVCNIIRNFVSWK